jgi:hypothetical protein
LKTGSGELFDRAREVFGYAVSHRPSLAADGQAKWIGAKLECACGKETCPSGCGRRVFQEFSS